MVADRMKPPPRASNVAGVAIHVENVPPASLTPPAREVRRRTRQHVQRIARSLSEFGFLVPLIVDGQMRIVAGHSRWEAAKLLGLSSVPVIRVEHLTEGQLRLFAIADNKLPEGVEWDQDQLRIEFGEIELVAPELELSSSGFAIAEIDTMYGRHRTTQLSEHDDEPEPPAEDSVNRLGDVWRLGRHAFACGDARDSALIGRLLNGASVRTLLSDPPWNLKIEGVVSGNGRVKHADFVMAAGEMTKPAFTAFLGDFLGAAKPHLSPGALAYVYMDWRNYDALVAAAVASGFEQKNMLVWCKDNAGMGSMYRSQHELVGLFKADDAPHTNNINLGRHGRNRANCLFYPGVNSFGKGRDRQLKAHPTCKPVSMLADLILDSSAPGEIILDPFGGSGSTLIAAEKVDRTACLIELDPGYADGIVRRFERVVGTPALHVETGLSFAELAHHRATEALAGEKADV
ncbi:site-specific DNA-methyltransferase [Sphingomonas profundi]|uniref:site-specific DNA-methyltransferase n=1 Tax=Alterirhizorhabdus profundi TaxID=2681549 RepID=UPI0012E91BEC|nr:DNA methyltransferase [Sphingomonas profundi]